MEPLRPVRVVIISPYASRHHAGWIRQTLSMIRACDPRRVTFTWISPPSDRQPELSKLRRFTSLYVGSSGSPKSRSARMKFGIEVAWHLLNNRKAYDVIYCPCSYAPAELITLIALLSNKPIVLRAAGAEFSTSHAGGRLRRWFLTRAATALVVLNSHLLRDLRMFVGDKVHWHPNGVNTEVFHPGSADERIGARQRWGFTDSQKVILFVGPIAASKGVDTLVSAFAEVARMDSSSILCLAGRIDTPGSDRRRLQGTSIDELQAEVQRQGLEARIQFLGHVSDVAELMRAVDFFVLPSLSEGMPNVLLEAMATGIPCVASDIPGIQDLVTSGDNGFLFEPGDSRVLAKHLIHLIKYPAESRRLGDRARQMIEQRFSIETTVQEYQTLFLQLRGLLDHAS